MRLINSQEPSRAMYQKPEETGRKDGGDAAELLEGGSDRGRQRRRGRVGGTTPEYKPRLGWGRRKISEAERGSGGRGVPLSGFYLHGCAPFMHHPESSVSGSAPEEIN